MERSVHTRLERMRRITHQRSSPTNPSREPLHVEQFPDLEIIARRFDQPADGGGEF
jgi:hypothetical protein